MSAPPYRACAANCRVPGRRPRDRQARRRRRSRRRSRAASARPAAASASAMPPAPLSRRARAAAGTARNRAAPTFPARASCARGRHAHGGRGRRENRRGAAHRSPPGWATRPDARSENRGRKRGRAHRRRRYGPTRGARRRAIRPTARSPRADPRRPRTVPAAPAPAVPESSAVPKSTTAFEPLADGDVEGAGKEAQELGARDPDRKRPGLRVPMHSSPVGAERLNERRTSACERTRPAAPPNKRRVAVNVGRQHQVAVGAEQRIDHPRLQQMDAVHRQARRRAVALSTPIVTTSTSSSTARSVVTICSSCSKLGAASIASTALCTRHWLARLPRLVAIRRCCSSSSRASVVAQPFEHEMLEIEDAVAELAARRAQQAQCLGMPVEKIGMTAQIGDDVAGTEFARQCRRRTATANRFRLVLRTVGHGSLNAARPCRSTDRSERRGRRGARSYENHLKPTSERRGAAAEGRLPHAVSGASVADARSPCQFCRHRVSHRPSRGRRPGDQDRACRSPADPGAAAAAVAGGARLPVPRGRGGAGARQLRAGDARAAPARRRGMGRRRRRRCRPSG